MTYTLKNSDWQWQIQTDNQSKRSVLSYKRPTNWVECKTYDSPEAAADAVAQGKTGEKEWDDIKHTTPVAGLASWLIDPGAAIPPILPIVTDLIKDAILAPLPETGKT